MEGKLVQGYLALADITGFTSFLASTELEHAQDILGELMELLVARLTPVLTLVELEGDAVYVCAGTDAVPSGGALLDLYEGTYAAFKDRVAGIKRNTICDCNACRLSPTLDLKFITHFGDYYLQSVAGRQKPVGSPVNLLHRMAKNRVTEATGWRGYALFSAAAADALALDRSAMRLQRESYEHLGEVETVALGLESRYRELQAARRVFVSPEEADVTLHLRVEAPPPQVWDWLNDPQKRALWQRVQIKPEKVNDRGVGVRNHCHHGKNAESIQTILDWRPFDYFTYDSMDAGKDRPDMVMTHRLDPDGSGTQLTVTIKLLMPLPALVKSIVGKLMLNQFHVRENYDSLARLAS